MKKDYYTVWYKETTREWRKYSSGLTQEEAKIFYNNLIDLGVTTVKILPDGEKPE